MTSFIIAYGSPKTAGCGGFYSSIYGLTASWAGASDRRYLTMRQDSST
jgi:hypothetical protein